MLLSSLKSKSDKEIIPDSISELNISVSNSIIILFSSINWVFVIYPSFDKIISVGSPLSNASPFSSVKNFSPVFVSICTWKIGSDVFASLTTILISCDENFEPRQENTAYFFSIYGYLDASVDTQWVRLTPVRDNFDPDTDQIDVNVVIRNIETGEEVTMNDSLFNPNSLVAYWNFWSTMSIEPEQTYEIVATNNEREQSRVVVTIPKDYPTPINAINRDIEYMPIELKKTWGRKYYLTNESQMEYIMMINS